jgi:SAM-dependent methyltransferase
MDPRAEVLMGDLIEAAARPFAASGKHAWHYARGKLRHDPVYLWLLARGVLPGAGTLVDLGCGQGILLALLVAAREQFRRGAWPSDWPAPPGQLAMRGFELRARSAKAGQQALGGQAHIERGDIRAIALPRCRAIVLLDVLYHLGNADQERLLQAAATALEPGGVLVLREADASAGLAFRMTQGAERIMAALRGQLLQKLAYRAATQWLELLRSMGLAVQVEPMSAGTPFANVLFVARRAA